MKIIHLPLLNPPRSQPYEIVLIEPLIERDQVLGVGRVKPFKIFNRVNNAIDSPLKGGTAPHLLTNVIAVLKVVYEDAQTQECKDGDADHHSPVASRGNGERCKDENNRRGAIAQKASEQKHQNWVDHERAEPNCYPFVIATLERRS